MTGDNTHTEKQSLETQSEPQRKSKKEPFFKTLPGILTGIAAVLTALGGLITGLVGAGLIGSDSDVAVADTGLYIVSTIPENHATKVDPETGEIIVEFNSALKPDSYSIVLSDLGTTPVITGDPTFSEDNICSIPVALEPDTTYAIGFNDSEHANFVSAEDEAVSADPYVLVFSTE